MSAANASPLDVSRHQRDQLILQVELVPLAGRILTIDIFEVQSSLSAPPKITPTMLSRPASQSSVTVPPLSTSRTAGFRVAAHDEVENEYSLFVSRQKAEYLYRAAYPAEAAASEWISPEAMANGILTHLSIIGNRQRDVGKLTCREPEPHYEKKTRTSPTNTSPQKNSHLASKRPDQRAIRVQKTSIRAMEAASKAVHRSGPHSADFERTRGSILLEAVPRADRKASQASILHRMAGADSQSVWGSGLQTNYEEPEFVHEDNDDFQRHTPVVISPLSPVKRALPDRKTKHKGLEERRQVGRQQRILAAQAAQEASLSLLHSFHPQDFYNDVIEESELENRNSSRRSSMVTTVPSEIPIPQVRAASAPRSSVGNAYALKNLTEREVVEPEQFLRRRTLDKSSRSVFKAENWNDDVLGMEIEITDERPVDQDSPMKLDMSNGARRVMLANSFGSTLQRISSKASIIPERRSTSASPTTAALSGSSSAPVLRKPDEEDTSIAAYSVSPRQSIVKAVDSPRPRSESKSAGSEVLLNMEDKSMPNVVAPPDKNGIDIQVPDHRPSTAPLIEAITESRPHVDAEPKVEIKSRSRSNSLGMEGMIRLAPLTSRDKPLIQEFLAPPEPVKSIDVDLKTTDEEQEVQFPPPDPEIVLYTPENLVAENDGDPTMEKNEDSIDQGQTIPHQEVFDSIDTHEMPIVDTGAAPHESIAPLDGLPPVIQNQKSSTPPLTARQSCWEEQVPPIAVVVPEGSLSLNGSVPDATISSTRPDKIENDLADAVQESEKNVDPCESHTNVIYSAEMQDPGVEILLAESRKPGEGEDVSEAEVPDESNGSNQPQEPATEKNSVDSVDSVLNVGNEEVIEKGYLVPVDPIHCVGNVGMIKNGSNMVGQSLCDPNSEQTHFQIDDAPQQSQISEEDPSPDEMAVDNSTESQPTTIGEGLVDVIQLEATDVLMDSILSNQLAATAIENDVNPAADTAGITSPTFIDSNDNPPLTDNITVQVLENATCQAIEITSASPDDNDHALAHEYPSENDKMTPRVGDDIEGDENIDTPTNEDESMNLNRLRGSIGKSPSNAKTILEDNESSTTQDFPEEPISLPLVKAASPHAHKQKGMDGSNGQPEKKADGLADLKVARHKRSVSKERESVPGEIIDGKVHSEALKPMDSSSSPNNKGTKKKLTKDKLNAIEPQILAQHKRKDSSPPAVKEIAPTVTIPVQLDEPLIESPKNEKASGVSRRKSQSSSNNVVLPSSTGQVKSPVKGSISRKRSVVQLTEAQTIGPIPELKQQPVEDVNIASHRRSVRRVSSVRKSDVLPGPSSPTNAEKVPGEAKPAQSKLLPAKRQSSRLVGASPKVSNYHKKWGKWLAGRKIIEKASCLQLEERVLQDPRDGENLLKLGLRYAQWHGTSLPGILLLEHATLLHKNTIGSHEYWFWLGSAHLDMFMRHRKYLPIARFHLGKCIRAFTSAFAYMEALVDPMLLLRYAIGLFWHKGDGNLEKTCEIFHELFSRFVIFCDKDRPNLLFLQFQVLHRLKLYVDAIECMNKILEIHENPQHSAVSNGMSRLSSEPVAQVSVYDTMDYLLMLMQCQKATGDSVSAAQTLSSVLKLKNAPQDNTLKDDEHFELWCTLAEKCFHHEDYALAVEYYALALNFAKQSEELATIHYNLGLCFQALGEDSKCVTEYKRARTSNRHVTPLVSLAELAASYEEQFALLRQKSVAQTVEEVRVDLYGRAVKRLQRIFRRNRKDLHNNANDTSSESSVTKMPTLSKRRSTVGNPPALVKIEDVAEGTEAEDTFQQNGDGVNDNQISKCDDSALEVIERRHESFLARKQAAMEEMAALLTNPQYRYQVAPHALDSNVRPKVGIQVRSGMLSPEKDRLDMRRNQSLEAFRQLGYVSSTMPWIEFWEKLLPLASELFESRQTLYGSIARIRGRLPLVTDEIAFCALAESIGNVHQAAEKLHDSLYERELTYVCAVIDVSKQLMRDFPSEPTQVTKPVRVSLPTILSPTAESHSPVGSMSPNRVLLPPYSPARASPSKTQTPTKHLRMNQMVNLQFQEHVQQQEAAMAIADATGKPRQQTEKLLVLQGFRQANSALLSSQVSFGSEKAAT